MNAPLLEVENLRVTYRVGRRRVEAVKGVSFSVARGRCLGVVGESGSGKSSLLRAIAGLWRSGEGSIQRPPVTDSMFLPQRPYMQVGSLRSQLLYPQFDRELDDAVLHQALHDVNLPDLVQRSGGLDTEVDWAKTLSLGEQQRLAFARAILLKPRWLFCDEASSALDEAAEQALYALLVARLPHTAIVSIAHRPALAAFHQRIARFEPVSGGPAPFALKEALPA